MATVDPTVMYRNLGSGDSIYAAGWYFTNEGDSVLLPLCDSPGPGRAVQIDRISFKSVASTVIDYLQCDFGVYATAETNPGQYRLWFVGALADAELIVYEPKRLIGPENQEPRVLLTPGIKIGIILEGRIVRAQR